MSEADLVTAMFSNREAFLSACRSARRVRTPEGVALLLGDHVLLVTPPEGVLAKHEWVDWLADAINRFGTSGGARK
jgi:hypothetical protein